MISEWTKKRIQDALEEDLGEGDITTVSILPANHRSSAEVIARDGGVVAGSEAFKQVFAFLDNAVTVHIRAEDGLRVEGGQVVATLQGPSRALLAGERLALNLYGRLSGIASLTRRYVDAVWGTDTKILDTRKTTPCWRELERAAVRAGGGQNHRNGLFDMILIKDNHIAAAGSITAAVEAARRHRPEGMPIEVEASNLDEVRQAVAAGADLILFDNMDLPTTREAVKIARGKAITEASGRMTLDRVKSVAETGVDRISVGALTHSFKVLDLSLEVDLD